MTQLLNKFSVSPYFVVYLSGETAQKLLQKSAFLENRQALMKH